MSIIIEDIEAFGAELDEEQLALVSGGSGMHVAAPSNPCPSGCH